MGLIYTPISERLKSAAEVIDISKGWDVSFARAKDYPNFGKEENVEELVPLSDSKPDFSGIIRYKKFIKLDKAVQKAMIKIENIFDVLRVFVNGKEAGVKLTPPYIILFEGLLREGNNEVVCEVATTPARDQRNYPSPPFDFNHEVTDPTGMFGKVKLYLN